MGALFVFLSSFLFVEAHADKKPDPKNRLKTYDLLIQTQDGVGETLDSIQSLERLVSEIEENNLEVDRATQVRYRQQLAEHYIWHSAPEKAVQILSKLESNELTANGRAVKFISLFETGKIDEAKEVLIPTGALMKSDLEKRVAEIRDEIKRDEIKRDEIKKDEANHPPPPPQEPDYSNLDFGTLATQDHTMWRALMKVSAEVAARRKIRLNPYADYYSFRELGSHIYEVKLGLESRTERSTRELIFGYRGHTNALKFPIRLKLTSTGFLDFISTELNYAALVFGSDDIIRSGVSEHKGSVNVSHRLSPWVAMTAVSAARVTQRGSSQLKGTGGELSSRGYLGRSQYIQAGPWIHFVRWNGGGDEAFNALLVRRLSLVGLLAKLSTDSLLALWRFELISGWGYDLSTTQRPGENLFSELDVEKKISSRFHVKLSGAYYTGQLSSSLRSGTVLSTVSVVYQM